MEIKFNEDRHEYHVDKIKFQSVTTFIGSFFPKFDAETISYRYAKKRGLKQQDVLDMWKKKGEDAAAFGNRMHHYSECLVNNTQLPAPENEREHRYYKAIEWAFKTLGERFTPKYAERKIASKRWKLAGTIDLWLENETTILLGDWKTVEKLDTHNPFDIPFYPIEHLPATNLTKYKLQLDVYRNMLLETTKKEILMKLIHLHEGGVTIHPLNPITETRMILNERDNKLFSEE